MPRHLKPDGTPLPKIQDGTLGDLVLQADHLVDEAERRELEEESVLELLPPRSVVFMGLSPGMNNGTPRGLVKSVDLRAGYGYLFAEVRLQESLKLRLRGDKEPALEDCKCTIPRLNAEARSLNHAFTLLSTKYETKRISHTGNVFTRVYCYSHSRKVWHHWMNCEATSITSTAYLDDIRGASRVRKTESKTDLGRHPSAEGAFSLR